MALVNAVAIVTGGAIGIGFAIAEELGRLGARLVVADREGAAHAAVRLAEKGYDAVGLDVDVAMEDSVRTMAKAAEERFGGIDVLVNNAGIFSTLVPKPFDEIEVEEFRRVMDVNVMGVFLCAKAVLPAFRRRGGGRIVNISSGVAFKGNP